jgi:hypothetical protein
MANQVFIAQFQPGLPLSKQELAGRLQVQYPEAKPTTIDWHIYRLLQQGLLAKSGRNQYQVVGTAPMASSWTNPPLPEPLNEWIEPLRQAFPYLTICLWSTRWLQPLLMHLPFTEYGLIEVERSAVDAVWAFCQDKLTVQPDRLPVPVVRAGDWPVLESYLSNAPVIGVVKPLISESPLQPLASVSTITVEKLLVDLLADRELFFAYQEDLTRIVEGLSRQSVINGNRLRRYARRRNHLPQLEQLLATAQISVNE